MQRPWRGGGWIREADQEATGIIWTRDDGGLGWGRGSRVVGFCCSPEGFVRAWTPAFKVNKELLQLLCLGSVWWVTESEEGRLELYAALAAPCRPLLVSLKG